MEIFSSLGIEWGKLLAQIVNFGILILVLTKFVYKPLMKTLDEREATIKKISENSVEMEKTLLDTKTREEEILKEARLQGEKIIKQSEASAETIRKSLLEESRKDAEKIISDGQKRIEEEREKFYGNLKAELSSLVSAGIEKTIGGYITKDAEAKLKDEALEAALSLKK